MKREKAGERQKVKVIILKERGKERENKIICGNIFSELQGKEKYRDLCFSKQQAWGGLVKMAPVTAPLLMLRNSELCSSTSTLCNSQIS
jgi:hypothetical protein